MASSPIRFTRTVRDVLEVLQQASAGDSPTYGLEIMRATSLGSGTVYPILTRLERIGWVRAYWQEDDSARGPRRRMYELTGEGRAAVAQAMRPAYEPQLGWSQ